MTIEKNKSFFMMDSSEGNVNKEAIMDFVVSWTLRMAVDHKKIKRPILHKCSRNLLFKLIGKQNFKKTRVVKVETWKQYRKIDLWVRIILEENGVCEQHDVLIEDKVYSKLRDKQLSDIRSAFDKYLDEEQIITERHYILLTCMESYDANINHYSKASDDGFTLIPWDELMVAMFAGRKPMYSESEIFNEFWVKSWN